MKKKKQQKKRLLILRENLLKSLTKLSNQVIWDLGHAKLILNYFVRFCFSTKIWPWNGRTIWLCYTKSIKKVKIRIFLNVIQTLKHKSNKVVILSNDANLLVIVLYFVKKFVRESHKMFWIRHEIEDHTRYLLFDFISGASPLEGLGGPVPPSPTLAIICSCNEVRL